MMHLALYAALAVAISVGIAFGIHDSVAKKYMEDANPGALSAATLATGIPVLLAISPLSGGLRAPPLAALAFIAAGVLNFAIGRTLMYVATGLLTANGASVMTSTSAAFSTIMAFLLGEPVTGSEAMGIVMIITSVYLISEWRGRASLRGIGTGLLVGLAIAGSVAIIKVGEDLGGSPAAGFLIAYAAGLTALADRWKEARLLIRSRKGPVISMGVAAAAGQAMRYVALTSLPVDVVTPLQNLRPLVAAAVLSSASGQRRPRPRHWAAAALALLGVTLVSGLLRLT